MAISDLPILGMLKTRMQWHQARQRLLAENVSNADMPGFRPRDLKEPDFQAAFGGAAGGPTGGVGSGGLQLAATNPAHIAAAGPSGVDVQAAKGATFETRPSGNAVSLEDEMLKVAQNQMDYQVATSLYGKSLGLMKIALGKGG